MVLQVLLGRLLIQTRDDDDPSFDSYMTSVEMWRKLRASSGAEGRRAIEKAGMRAIR
jgi:hypothetical protein